MLFIFSDKVVALHLDEGTLKAHLYYQGSTVSLSFQTSLPHFESGCQAWYFFYSSIHCYPSQCGSWLPIMGKVGSRTASSSSHSSNSIKTFWLTEGGSVGIPMYQSISALLHPRKSTASESLVVECFQLSLGISGELHVSFLCIGCLILSYWKNMLQVSSDF